MNISIVGTGNMAKGLAGLLAKAGHQVYLGSRDPSKGAETAKAMGKGVSGGHLGAVGQSEVIFLAVPYVGLEEILPDLGSLSGKVVVDISNPLKPDFSGMTLGFTTSAAEEIAKKLNGARVVKAFNTVFSGLLASGDFKFGSDRLSTYVAADDAEAKKTVLGLAEQLGFAGVDAGSLSNARYLEPMGFFNIQLGYALGHGDKIGLVFKKR